MDSSQGSLSNGHPPAIPAHPTLTATALLGSLPMEARLAVGTAWALRVV